MFRPTKQQQGYKYAQVFDGANAYEVLEAKMLGWELVEGNMPESVENKDEKGHRRIGDTVLMRIPLDKYKEIEEYRSAVMKRSVGLTDEEQRLAEESNRLRAKGIRMFNFRDTDQLKRIVNKEEGI